MEEELLLVDARTLLPLAAGEGAVHHARGDEATVRPAPTPSGTHTLTLEFQQEQVEVVGPPCRTLAEQLASIHDGRLHADESARAVRGRVVALATPVFGGLPHLAPGERYRRIQEHVGLLAAEQLTCGFHVHVEVDDADEGVAVLDRIRVWLPVLLALSANSPFWYGVESGFASYRYQVMLRWPTAGPYEAFGSHAGYERHVGSLLRSRVPLDDGMVYFDARLSTHAPTVEVRVADVCMDPTHAAVLAALARALVETAARDRRRGVPPQPVSVTELRAWSWRASRFGVDELLVSPTTGTPAPAGDVVTELLLLLHPVLDEYGEEELVRSVVTSILADGAGTRRQRAAYARRQRATDVVADALDVGTPSAQPHPRASGAP
ncbi:carboxylate-amine ligase [Isoptericola variabilis J7]|nr:carboxylate-amine ligase [Isoptericola variabilis J7]